MAKTSTPERSVGMRVFKDMEDLKEKIGTIDAESYNMYAGEPSPEPDAPELVDDIMVDMLRPQIPNKLCNKADFHLLVTNNGDEVIPQGLTMHLENEYYRVGKVTLTEDLEPGQVGLLTVRVQPSPHARVLNFKETIHLSLKDKRKLLRKQSFKLNMRDFVGRLTDFKPADGGDLIVYIIGGQGAGKSALINSLVSILQHNEAIQTAVVRDADMGTHVTTVQLEVDPNKFTGNDGASTREAFKINVRFVDTVGMDKDGAYESEEMEAQLKGKLRHSLRHNQQADEPVGLPPAAEAHAVIFLVALAQLQDDDMMKEFNTQFKAVQKADKNALVCLSRVDEDKPEVLDDPINAKHAFLREELNELCKHVGVSKDKVEVCISYADNTKSERNFGLELNLYHLLERALRIGVAKSVMDEPLKVVDAGRRLQLQAAAGGSSAPSTPSTPALRADVERAAIVEKCRAQARQYAAEQATSGGWPYATPDINPAGESVGFSRRATRRLSRSADADLDAAN